MHADAVAGREDQRPLDDIAELADIARPVVRLERRHRLVRQRRRRDPPLGREAGEEMVDQLGNVLAPLAQRREAHRHDVQPIVEVLAEAALRRFRPARLRDVAESTRTSTLTGRWPPTR